MRTLIVGASLLPRNSLIALLIGYRRVISPLYGNVCRFYPSCSSYGLIAIQQHGAVRGTWFTVKRIARCNPWSAGGVDDVPMTSKKLPLTRLGFVSWQQSEEHNQPHQSNERPNERAM